MRSENNAESVGCMLSHMVGECKQPAELETSELETSGVWGELWSWQPRSWQPLGYGVSSSWQPLTSGPLTSWTSDLWGRKRKLTTSGVVRAPDTPEVSKGARYPRGRQKGRSPKGRRIPQRSWMCPRGHGCGWRISI